MGRIAGRLMNIPVRDSITLHPTESVGAAGTGYAWDMRLLFKRRITNLFISFSSLKSYVEVNHSGFRKILKKFVSDTSVNRLSDVFIGTTESHMYNEVNMRARCPDPRPV